MRYILEITGDNPEPSSALLKDIEQELLWVFDELELIADPTTVIHLRKEEG